MRTISVAVRAAICGSALMLMALPGISVAAEPGGMDGMDGRDKRDDGMTGWTE